MKKFSMLDTLCMALVQNISSWKSVMKQVEQRPSNDWPEDIKEWMDIEIYGKMKKVGEYCDKWRKIIIDNPLSEDGTNNDDDDDSIIAHEMM